MNYEWERDDALRRMNAAWVALQEQFNRTMSMECERPWVYNVVELGPCPIGDPDAEELQRIFEMESPH